MSQKKRMIAYALAGAVILMVYLSTGTMRSSRQSVRADDSAAEPSVEAPAIPEGTAGPGAADPEPLSASETDRLRRHQKRLVAAAWGRDPFRAKPVPVPGDATDVSESKSVSDSPVKKAPVPSLELTGICRDSTGGRAIINGSILEVGESVEGFRVEKILEDRVELSRNGGQSLVLIIE